MKTSSQPATVGRPRAFDTDVALEKAMKVFWQKGYEGASLSDLTEAMGINRPSLYAAYGNKEELYRKVLDRYSQGPRAYFAEALQEPTARGAVEKLLYSSAALLCDPQNPPGCLMVQSALCCGDDAESVRQETQARRLQGQCLLQTRFERAKTEGDLPASIDAADLARYCSMIMNGLSIQASNGAKCDELKRAIAIALTAFPGG